MPFSPSSTSAPDIRRPGSTDTGPTAAPEPSRPGTGPSALPPGPDSPGVCGVSVVIPVYRGEHTVPGLVRELHALSAPGTTSDGLRFRVTEIVLVHDCGPDRSDLVLRRLAREDPLVRVIWLSRNYGQDAATIAGMTAARSAWIVTMDEDGQHDPADIAEFLDTAYRERADLVYSRPTNTRPHGPLRNLSSRGAKLVLATLFAFPDSTRFESFRLIRADIGRRLAEVAGNGAYLDVALTWVVNRTASTAVHLRTEGRAESGYTYRRLFSLFWKMVLCTGTRGLRMVSLLGVTLALAGAILAAVVIYEALTSSDSNPEGWASTIVVLLLCSGALLFSMGLIAEYLGVVLHILVGKPLYLTIESPTPRPPDDAVQPTAPQRSEAAVR